MQRLNTRPAPVPSVLPVSLGGTSSITTADARTALDLASSDSLGQTSGLAVLDQNTKLDKAVFSKILPYSDCISGPAKIYIGQTVEFEITDYDSFQTYNVQATVGSVSISGSTITYTAPASAQPGGFTLTASDNRAINFDVLPAQPDQPTITTPVDNAVNVADTLQISASVFVPLGGVFTHQSSDWQVATDAAFTSIISQSNNDTLNKTTWSVTNPTPSTTYYLRCRYKGSNGEYGAWSTTVAYTTRSSFFPIFEEAVINKTLTRTAVPSPNGTTVVIGYGRVPESGPNYGGFRVYTKNAGSWAQEFSFQSGSPDDTCGGRLNVSEDGTKIVTMRINGNGSVVDNTGLAVGEICSFSKATGSWVAGAVFQTDRNYFPAQKRDIGMSHDHTRLVYCGVKKGSENSNNVVVARVYVRSGNTWVGEANLEVTVGAISASAFTCLMSGDGTTIVITC